MQNEEQPTGPARYEFEPPETASKVEFKRVRRMADPNQPSAGARKRTPPHRRWYVLGAAGLVLVLLLTVAWVGYQGVQAKNRLQTAAGLFLQLQQQIQRTDVAAAKGTLAALQVETKAARAATDGVSWSAASHLPGIGDDLTAVRSVSAVLDDLAVDGLPSLLDVASGLDPQKLSPTDGRIDLTSLTTAGPRIGAGLAVIREARAEVAGIDRGGLADQLDAAVGQLSDGLGKAEQLVSTADRAARLLPAMLGANGPRTYLLMFQNNAEARATGGMPGAYIVVRADGGAVTIVDEGTAAGNLDVFDAPVLPLTADQEGLYTDRPAIFPADVNLSPDFPTAARLQQAMYFKRKGVKVDGVLATDPVALSYLLRVTGAVKAGDGRALTSENAVRVLLSESYAKYPDPKKQDAYFSTTARAIFEALLNGQGDPKGMLTELARAAGERRLLVWSADAEEQQQLTGTVLAGRMPDDDGDHPAVGVFLNDGGGSKLSYYLNQSAELRVGDCTEEGTRVLHLKLTMASNAPAAGLPKYVTGLALSGDAHTSRTNVMVFSPAGGAVAGVTEGGREVDFGTGVERERGVAVLTVDLAPGARKTYDVEVHTGTLPVAGQAIAPRLWTTPGVRPWKTAVSAGGACA